jgi:transmembrane protein 18
MFSLSIWASRSSRALTPRLCVMVLLGGVVKLAERLNGWGSQYWKGFCTQNYFDRRGVFVATMLCAPLLLDSFIMLVCFLREASQLLIQVKTNELKKKKKPKVQEKSTQVKTRQGKKEE